MSNVQVGPPDLAQADKSAVAIANFLRHNSTIQQRQGILSGKRQDFFRVKRAVRALMSDAYQKAQKKSPHLPTINTREEALEAFRLLPLNRLAFRVVKLETEEAKQANLKPVRGVPVLTIYPQQEFGDDMYYTWFYEPMQSIAYLYAALGLAGVFAIVMFPLWPYKLRVGVWYCSMGLLGLLGVFFGIAIVRLILFCITYFIVKPGIWLFPNLFEDVGFVDSFIPLWHWHGVNCLPGANKNKNGKKRNLGFTPEEWDLKQKGQGPLNKKNNNDHGHSHGPGGHNHSHGGPGETQKVQLTPEQQKQQEAFQDLQQAKTAELQQRVVNRYKEEVQGENKPTTQEEDKALKNRLLQEEVDKIKQEIAREFAAANPEAARQAGFMQNSNNNDNDNDQEATSSGAESGSTQQPTKRTVTLEDDN